MIEERGRVVGVRGDLLEIVTEKRSACGSCSAKSGCGTSILSTWFPQRRLTFHLRNDVGAEAGDSVVLGLDERLLQRSSVLLYGLPLAGLLIGAIAGEQGFQFLGLSSELGAVLVGLFGLIVTLLLARFLAVLVSPGGDTGVRLLRVTHRPSSLALGEISMPGANQTQGFRT